MMTNREAYQLINVLLQIAAPAETKLEHARNQTLKNAQAFIERYNEKIKDLNIDFCSTNEKGHILRDQHGSYVYTKENERGMEKAVKEFLEEPVGYEFDVVATDDIKGLNYSQIEFLKMVGFVREI